MSYAIKTDLVPRRIPDALVIELTDDANMGAADDNVIQEILDEASATIDSYARLKYSVPLQLSNQVKGLCLDISIYRLYQRRDRISDSVRQAYEDAIAFLKDVSAGRAGLDQPAGATEQAGSGEALTTDVEERFSDDNLEGFV